MRRGRGPEGRRAGPIAARTAASPRSRCSGVGFSRARFARCRSGAACFRPLYSVVTSGLTPQPRRFSNDGDVVRAREREMLRFSSSPGSLRDCWSLRHSGYPLLLSVLMHVGREVSTGLWILMSDSFRLGKKLG